MTDADAESGDVPETREVEPVRHEVREVSSRLLEALELKGEVTRPGPGVSLCEGKNADKFFKIRHPWSLYGVPVEDMQKSMERLRVNLPKQGWKVVSYGPDGTPAKSLELIANSTRKKLSAHFVLQDRRGRSKDPSGIMVTVVTACYQVPEGKTVDEY